MIIWLGVFREHPIDTLRNQQLYPPHLANVASLCYQYAACRSSILCRLCYASDNSLVGVFCTVVSLSLQTLMMVLVKLIYREFWAIDETISFT
jgi:hypothetical protein